MANNGDEHEPAVFAWFFIDLAILALDLAFGLAFAAFAIGWYILMGDDD